MIDEAPTMPSGSTKKYWSAAELAVVLRTTLRAVYARMQRGGLPKPRRIGRRLLFNRKEVLAWIERQ
jgi:excisionase family DNA binding protein